jgi:hypothetical protein
MTMTPLAYLMTMPSYAEMVVILSPVIIVIFVSLCVVIQLRQRIPGVHFFLKARLRDFFYQGSVLSEGEGEGERELA